MIRTQQEAVARRKQLSESMSRMAQRSNPTPEDQVAFDHLEIEFRSLASLAADSSRASTRPPENPIGGEERTGNEFIDIKTGRAVRLLAPGDSFRSADPMDSHNREMKELGLGAFVRSMVTGPQNDLERRTLAESISGDGGYLVPTLLSEEIIDLLRAQARCIQAGAQTVKMPGPYFNIARLASDPVPAWRGENSLISESSPTFEAVSFRAHSVGTFVKASRELMEDASNLNDALRNAFAKSMALAIDNACLYGNSGPGGSPESDGPVGLAYQSGVTTTHYDGLITSYQPILDACLTLANANSKPPTAAIMAPRTDWVFNSLTDSLKQPLRRPPSIENLPFYSTTQIPVNESGGSPLGNDTSSIFTGYFPSMMIGIRSELRIDVLKERWADYGQIGFIVFLRADVQLEHAKSFVRTTGVM
jgi:HK97 family phage major capsid protein